MIYFLVNKELDLCKIGFTDNLEIRKSQLENEIKKPLKLINVFDGGLLEEKLYLRAYEYAKIKGEWFRYSKMKKEPKDAIKDFKKVCIGGFNFLLDNKNFINNSEFVKEINKKFNINFNSSQWLKHNTEFLKELKKKDKNITKNFKWIHPYIAFEMLRINSKGKVYFAENINDLIIILR